MTERQSFFPSIPNITVIGSGVMGRGITEVCLSAGFRTTLCDINEAALRVACDHIKRGLARSGVVERLAFLRLERTVVDAVARADVVIEAVPEKVHLKREVLQDVSAAASQEALLCTNTSTISITLLAEPVPLPERFVGMHFFNPVPRMRLVEIVRGSRTSDDTVALTVGLAKRMGKEPIVVNDSPGFASSRLGVVLGNEAMRMVEQGVATAEDIDTAMRLGYNHPMGPLELADLIGLDARLNNAQSMFDVLQLEQFRPPAILTRLVSEGRLGRKSGHGFYHYDGPGGKRVS